MNNTIEIMPIDHGWSHIKTANLVFDTAIEEVTMPTFFDNILEYEGKQYSVGGTRNEVKDNKAKNMDYYLLSLVAMAKELKKRNLREANVYIAAGLPLTRFGQEKQEFIDYLSQNKEVTFKFSEKEYHIRIHKVSVYPQCYAAVVDMIPTFPRKMIVVDIGSWTIDIMPVIDKVPYDPDCDSLPHGIITCMKAINQKCIRLFNCELDEKDIEHYIRFRNSSLPEEVVSLIEEELKAYAAMILAKLKEHEINVQMTPVIFVGGGAILMKNYGNLEGANIQYKTDIKANAKGYEVLAKIALKNARR